MGPGHSCCPGLDTPSRKGGATFLQWWHPVLPGIVLEAACWKWKTMYPLIAHDPCKIPGHGASGDVTGGSLGFQGKREAWTWAAADDKNLSASLSFACCLFFCSLFLLYSYFFYILCYFTGEVRSFKCGGDIAMTVFAALCFKDGR